MGSLLRDTRESLNLDLRAVSESLRIRFAHLLAIEEGRYNDLPGATYAVGFVRAYAEHLRLDGEEIVRRFKDESAIEPQNNLAFPTPVNEGGVPSAALIVVALLLAGGVYGAWHLMSNSDRSVAEMIQDVPERLAGLLPSREEEEPPVLVQDAMPAAPNSGPRFLSDEAVVTSQPQPSGETVEQAPAAPETAATEQPEAAAREAAVAEAPAPPAPAEQAVADVDEPPPPEDSVGLVPPEAAERAESAEPEVADPVVTAEAPALAPVTAEPAAPAAESPRAVVAESASAAREPVPTPMPTAADDRAAAPPAPMLEEAAAPAGGRVYGEENADARILLRATADAWVQVRDREGLVMTRLLKRGDVYRVPNRDGLTLMTGNAGGLVIEVDGTAMPALGRTGEVRRDVALDAARLKASAGSTN